MIIKLKRLTDTAVIPEYKTKWSSGMDLTADMGTDGIYLRPGEVEMISTGLAMEIPRGWEAQIRPRSGLAKAGITVANSPGTIDADYRGEIKILLINNSESAHYIRNGTRVAQMVFAEVTRGLFELTEDLDSTQRGDGGFGSTGE